MLSGRNSMTNSQNPPLQVKNWDKAAPTLKSLPAQLSLFHDAGPLALDRAEIERDATERGELFYTGKDLPGANERDQVILWDVP
jgi:hypothetical protein